MSTNVSSVVSHFPKPQNGFATTTSGSVSSGATTVGLNSVAGYSNGDVGVFVIDPTDATKKQTFTGIIDTSGVQVTSVVWTSGTNQSHANGATVVDYVTATHMGMMSKGILVAHDQTGVHKSGATYASPVLSGSVTGTYTLAGTPTITSPTISTPTIKTFNGWQSGSGTWSYVSSTTITVPSADAACMGVGTKVWITQTTSKYFNVTAVSGTTVTLSSPSGSTVANAAITSPYFSNSASPYGFPTSSAYIEIGRATLTGSADTITISSFPAKTYLRIVVKIINSGSVGTTVTFNNDTSTNYASRNSRNGGAETTSTSASSIQVAGNGSSPLYVVMEVINIAAQEKIVYGITTEAGTSGAGNVPVRQETSGKWSNTSDQITRVDVNNSSTGDFASGSEIVVYGRD